MTMQNNLLMSFIVAFALSVLVVLTKSWHGALTFDGYVGAQKMHTQPTPRIGGLPIYLSLWLVLLFVEINVSDILLPILLASLPAFVFGMAEDVSKRVGVLARLLATMLSGALAYYLTGYSLTRLDFSLLDACLKWMPISVLFTAFAIGGVANAINIVDGLNGLSSLTSVFAFSALAMVAYSVGDASLAAVCLLMAMAVAGFFCVNWPLGKIFLGDGGSYFLGFTLAWLSVLLAERHQNVSAFVALLICIHPITEVIFSIFRRTIRKSHPGHADRLHLHSLIKTRVIRHKFAACNSVTQNSIAGLVVGCLTVFPAITAQFVFNSTRLSVLAVLVFVVVFVALYARIVRFRWYSPLKFLFLKSTGVKSA